jgi:hypothetical protein
MKSWNADAMLSCQLCCLAVQYLKLAVLGEMDLVRIGGHWQCMWYV